MQGQQNKYSKERLRDGFDDAAEEEKEGKQKRFEDQWTAESK